MKTIFTFVGLIICIISFAQKTPCSLLKPDSCILPNVSVKQAVEIQEVVIKNNYQVQFIKHKQKNYLNLIVKDNLGFGQSGSLLLLSNKKQYFLKSVKLEPIDKMSAYFLIELNANYLLTLRENGLTNIIFKENAEFVIPKVDSEIIKKNAMCFSDIVNAKK